MPWGAAIGAAAAIGGSIISSDASRSAANKQSDAASSAADAQLQQFNTINQQQAPYRNAGYTSLAGLLQGLGQAPTSYSSQNLVDMSQGYPQPNSTLYNSDPNYREAWDRLANVHQQAFGTGYTSQSNTQAITNSLQDALAGKSPAGVPGVTSGQFTHQFNANDLNENLAPNYEFMLNQGLGQAKNMANATGGLLSGNTLQGLNTFAQNYAQNAYQQAYNNYNQNQTNIFNRLADIAGIGQTANNASAQYGTAATQAASNYLTSGAAAQAAGTVGQANALSSGLSTAGNYYALSKLFGNNGGGTGTWTGGDSSSYGGYA